MHIFRLLYLCRCAHFFGYVPSMQNFAKNVIEYNISIIFCDLHRHESLAVMIQLQFLSPLHAFDPPPLVKNGIPLQCLFKPTKLQFQSYDHVDVNYLQVLIKHAYLSLSIMCSKQWSCPLMYASILFDWKK
jgi:hypothetical protein